MMERFAVPSARAPCVGWWIAEIIGLWGLLPVNLGSSAVQGLLFPVRTVTGSLTECSLCHLESTSSETPPRDCLHLMYLQRKVFRFSLCPA